MRNNGCGTVAFGVVPFLPVVIPKTNPKLQFIYTEDLATIIECLLKTNTGKESIFNVGNRDAVTSREWVEACAAIAENRENIVFKANVDKNLYEIIAELSV